MPTRRTSVCAFPKSARHVLDDRLMRDAYTFECVTAKRAMHASTASKASASVATIKSLSETPTISKFAASASRPGARRENVPLSRFARPAVLEDVAAVRPDRLAQQRIVPADRILHRRRTAFRWPNARIPAPVRPATFTWASMR
jgi:hypothetical protein